MYFDHEKRIVYQKCIEFVDEITLGKALLFPVVKMLSKMTEYSDVAREEMAGY